LVLTEDERKAAEARILEELEEEHARRLRRLEHKRQRVRSKREQQAMREKELVIAEMRDGMRHEFYTERGYKLYIDSRGRENWLTPEEYEWRTKVRRRRRRTRKWIPVPSFKGARLNQVLIYAGMLALAVVLGMLISR
jgi:hypothetical protein